MSTSFYGGSFDRRKKKRSETNSYQPLRKDEVITHSTGRAPWYDLQGKPIDAYVIGIAGGSASGKTSVAQAILKRLNNIPTVLILSQDSFYRKHTQAEVELAFNNDLDLDHPDAIDTELFAKCLRDLKKGRATQIPVYSFMKHREHCVQLGIVYQVIDFCLPIERLPEKKYIYGAAVIIVEGIMTLTSPELRELYDLRIFVNADSDLMLARRIRRDIAERGRDVEGVLDQYLRFVKRSYDNFIRPSSAWADIIVPGIENQVAIDLLVTHIQQQLDARSLRFRDLLTKCASTQNSAVLQSETSFTFDQIISSEKPPSKVLAGPRLNLLEQTNQLQGILTIIRDRTTERSDLIFYTDRLSSLIVENAFSLLVYDEVEVTTPLGLKTKGRELGAKTLVGVTVQPSGGPFAKGLRRVIRDVQLGSMLIQADQSTGEPLLFHTSFPECIKSYEEAKEVVVFLMDSQIGTGAAALMAIRVLLDHGVQEHHIIFLAFIVANPGIAAIERAFPRVHVVAATGGDKLIKMKVHLSDATIPANADVEDVHMIHALEREDMRFSRYDEESERNEKIAWVIEPDMGHIGDRYYLQ